jgi:hypothetical protein
MSECVGTFYINSSFFILHNKRNNDDDEQEVGCVRKYVRGHVGRVLPPDPSRKPLSLLRALKRVEQASSNSLITH